MHMVTGNRWPGHTGDARRPPVLLISFIRGTLEPSKVTEALLGPPIRVRLRTRKLTDSIESKSESLHQAK